MVASNSGTFPVQAITYNHRSEAMYRAIARDTENAYVARALATGLENVRLLASTTPPDVRSALCSMHNNYHFGAGDTFLSLLDKSEELMAAWEQRVNGPNGTGLTTRNSQYDTFLEKFVFGEMGGGAFWGDSLNFFKTTCVVNNYFAKFGLKDDLRAWTNANMHFAECKLSNRLGCALRTGKV